MPPLCSVFDSEGDSLGDINELAQQNVARLIKEANVIKTSIF